jgi:uncharacterized membrane protein YkoI
MSLLRKPRLNARWKKLLLLVVSLLLVVPCVAAASLAMRFEVNSTAQNPSLQEPSQQEKEAKEKAMVERQRQEEVEFKKRIAADPVLRAEFEERARKQELELKARALNQATLARLARITMEQAIQIATSQQPGKVLESSLVGEHWEAPGKLAADGKVLYHIVIIAGEEPNLTVTHALVNAIDGTILKEETEKPRRRNPEPQ